MIQELNEKKQEDKKTNDANIESNITTQQTEESAKSSSSLECDDAKAPIEQLSLSVMPARKIYALSAAITGTVYFVLYIMQHDVSSSLIYLLFLPLVLFSVALITSFKFYRHSWDFKTSEDFFKHVHETKTPYYCSIAAAGCFMPHIIAFVVISFNKNGFHLVDIICTTFFSLLLFYLTYIPASKWKGLLLVLTKPDLKAEDLATEDDGLKNIKKIDDIETYTLGTIGFTILTILILAALIIWEPSSIIHFLFSKK